jgi:hypothetical protein
MARETVGYLVLKLKTPTPFGMAWNFLSNRGLDALLLPINLWPK